MPIRRSPNRARHTLPQVPDAGRDRPERVVAINRNRWSSSIGIGGRDQPVRARGLPRQGFDPDRFLSRRSSAAMCCPTSRFSLTYMRLDQGDGVAVDVSFM